MGVVAGVDTSTQSCTVSLHDAATGALLGTGRAPHPVTSPPVSEQHPDAWRAALLEAFAAACGSVGLAATDVDAISVGGQAHGLVMLDEADRVLRPAKLWNDTTSAEQAARLVESLGVEGWVRAVGSVPTAAFTITKLAWVADHEPQHLDHLAHVLLPHDYLTHLLTGRYVTDRSEASGTGYYAAHEDRWLLEHLETMVGPADWGPRLPTVLGPSEPAGPATGSLARELGLRPDCVVGPGGGDQHVGTLGIGLQPGDVLYSLGTSGVVMTPSSAPVFDLSGWVDGVADAAGGWLPLVCTLNATKVTDAFARLLGVDHAELSRLALAAPVRADRAVLVAYLDGERTPERPHARGLLGGLRSDLTREEFALAAFEGVVLGLVRGQRAIDAAGVPTDGVTVVTGGGARSAAYRQVLADATGRPVETRAVDEAVARGAAIQASAVLGGAAVADVREEWLPGRTSVTEPRDGVPDEVLERYLGLASTSQRSDDTVSRHGG
ncbi:xylulokinase [Actinotalea sp. M2MS4P-6]|uniref:xylulokinase n=1 Tax=Actinotalea sp. M2MS4P-6 TaxID=2983762 RepID=UPI0021E4845A|nr:xylulokinase [Actinotalea sp. M2MS4P-6]MCV2395125.1 xylulokinase [Actinotalea sp. M2MS4P-6]